MSGPVLYITIVQTSGNRTEKIENLGGESNTITYQQIQHEVEMLLPKGIAIAMQQNSSVYRQESQQQRVAQLFYRQRQEQKRLRGDQQFGYDVHVYVRLEDDFQLMKNRIIALKNKYLQAKSYSNSLDLFSLARNHSFNQKKSYISSQQSMTEPELDLAILISNPLVRLSGKSSSDSSSDKFSQVERAPISFRRRKKEIKRILQETQPVVQFKIAAASKREIEQCSRDSAMILELVCDMDLDEKKQPMLLLEDSESPGLEQRVPIESLFTGTEKHNLVVVVGKDAHLALQPLKQKAIQNVLTINTTCYSTDRMASEFLGRFYRMVMLGFLVNEAFNQALKDVTTPTESNKLNEICCCLHEHNPQCKWLQLVERFGLETCHNELHQSCEKDSSSCKIACAWGASRIDQVLDKESISEYASKTCQDLCCCYFQSRQEHHLPANKFLFEHERNVPLYSQPESQQKIDTEFIVRVPRLKCRITNTYCESDYMPHRNSTVYGIMCLITSQNIVNIYEQTGTLNAERQLLVRNAVAYLLEREHPIEFTELQMKTVTSTEDFRLRVKEKLSPNRNYDLEELSQRLADRTLVMLFNNCEDYLKQNFSSFVEITNDVYNQMAAKLTMRIVLLTSQPIASQYFFIGESSMRLSGLTMRGSIDSFLAYVVRYRSSNPRFSFKPYQQKLMEIADKLTILHGKLKLLELQLNESHLEFIAKKLLNNNLDKSIDLLLKELKPQPGNFGQTQSSIPKELKVLLQLIAEFGEGLSDRDLDFLTNLQFARSIVPVNWRSFIIDQINGPTDGLFENRELRVCRHYYFDITQKYGSNLFQIKANIRRLNELPEQKQYPKAQLRLRALQYLAVYTFALLQRYKDTWDYSEHLFEYTNVSDTGIFFYRKFNKHSELFEQGDYFPDVRPSLMMSESSNIRDQERDIQNHTVAFLGQLTPQQGFLHHRENLLAIYKVDVNQFNNSTNEDDDLRPNSLYRFSSHYYYTLLLNIPTLFRIQMGKVNQQVVAYAISNSIRCASVIRNSEKTHHLLLIKLYCLEIGFKRFSANREELQKAINERQSQITELLEVWRDCKQQNLQVVWQCQSWALMLLQHLTEDTITDPMQFIQFLAKVYKHLHKRRQLIDEKNWRLMMARLTLLTAQCFRRLGWSYREHLVNCRPFDQIVSDLSEAATLYSEESRVLLMIQCRLERMYLESKLFFESKPTEQAAEKYCQEFKEKIDSTDELYINNPVNKITDGAAIELFRQLRDENNSRIWKVFHNLFVFMRADPKASDDESQTIPVRRPSKLRGRLREIFAKCKLNIVSIFKPLTQSNLRNILQNGCLLLALTVDVEIVNEEMFLRLEDRTLPIARQVPVTEFISLFYTNIIDTIILMGRNVADFANLISKKANGQCHPTLIILDTLIEDSTVDTVQEYFIRIKQQKITELFLQQYCKQIVGRGGSRRPQLVVKCIDGVLDRPDIKPVEGKRSKFTYRECAERYIRNRVYPSTVRRQVRFGPGSYTDASGQVQSPHNFSTNDDYLTTVGRQSQLLWITKYLVNEETNKNLETSVNMSATVNQLQFMNLYGAKGVGKKELLTDIAWQLILKNVFKDGIYKVDCEHLKARDRERQLPRSILQFIEAEFPQLYKKLTDTSRPLDMLLVLLNTHKVSDLDSDELLRLIEERHIKVIFTTTHPYSGGKFRSYKLQLKDLNRSDSQLLVCSLTQPEYVWRELGITQNLRNQLLKGIKVEEFNSPLSLKEQAKKISVEESGRWTNLQPFEDSMGLSLARSRKMSESNAFQLTSQLQSSLLGSYMGSRTDDRASNNDNMRMMMASSIGINQRRQIKLTLTGL